MSATLPDGAAAPAPEYHSTIPVPLIALAWIWVATPFAYGLWQLLIKVGSLFGS